MDLKRSSITFFIGLSWLSVLFGCGSPSFNFDIYVKLSPSVSDPNIYFQAGNIFTLFIYDTTNETMPYWWIDFDGTKKKSITVPASLGKMPVWIRVLVMNPAGVYILDGFIGGPYQMFIIEEYASLQIELFPR